MAANDNLSSKLDAMLSDLVKPKVKPEILLAELDDVLRNRPTPGEICNQSSDAIGWIGGAAAVVEHWNSPRGSAILIVAQQQLYSGDLNQIQQGYRRLIALLTEMRQSIRMASGAALSIAVEPGAVFDYFDGLRKIIERAAADLFFIDPYLDAEFVSRYLGFSPSGVTVCLLTGQQKLATLIPAVDVFARQHGAQIAVRTTDQIHDRFVIVDRKECFQSGASFKDGGAKAPTTVTQITDAFQAMLQTYETMWGVTKVVR